MLYNIDVEGSDDSEDFHCICICIEGDRDNVTFELAPVEIISI